jgi:hypothetical protein
MMSEFISLSELGRRLNISPPKARRLLKIGVFTPSGTGVKGPVFNSAFIPAWKQAMLMSHNPPKQ